VLCASKGLVLGAGARVRVYLKARFRCLVKVLGSCAVWMLSCNPYGAGLSKQG
jgi:hypothetical protein